MKERTEQEQYLALEERVLAFLHGAAADDRVFEALALDIHAYQFEHNAPYRAYCQRLGARERLAAWRDIPAVPQSAFKHAALRTFPESETVTTFRTSGTTGEGFGSHHFRSTRLYDEAILAGWDFFQLPTLPQRILTAPPADAPHSSLSHMMGTLGALAPQRFLVSETGIDVAPLRSVEAPVLVMGTALAILHLCEAGEKFALPKGSAVLETGGYKGSGRSLRKGDLYRMIGDALGVPATAIINEYGMTELSSQFYTRGLGGVHRGPPWTRAVVIDPETNREAEAGEAGVLRIWDLANVGSVLAIQTQDLAVRRADGFELLGRDPAALPRGCSRAADEMLSRE